RPSLPGMTTSRSSASDGRPGAEAQPNAQPPRPPLGGASRTLQCRGSRAKVLRRSPRRCCLRSETRGAARELLTAALVRRSSAVHAATATSGFGDGAPPQVLLTARSGEGPQAFAQPLMPPLRRGGPNARLLMAALRRRSPADREASDA